MSNLLSNKTIKDYREDFSKKAVEYPLFESSLLKNSMDFEKMELSTFTELTTAPSGYVKIDEIASLSFRLEEIPEFDKEFLEPKSGFGYFALSNSEKMVFLDCKNSEKIGFLRISGGKGLTLEPVFIQVPAITKSSLLINFDLSNGEAAFDLIRTKVEEGGNLSLYLLFENFIGKRFVDFSVQLGKESSVNVYPVFLGGPSSLFLSTHRIYNEKSVLKENLLALLKNNQKGDFRTRVTEEASQVNVKSEVRAVFKDSSRAFISGLLKVKKQAMKSNSLYSAHCLKLSPNSRVDVEPDLEIEALDVTASHSASISPVDEEKLFYLESRGLDREKAKKELSSGFLFSSIVENDYIKEKIEEIL